MAKRPAKTTTTQDTAEIPPAMDYAAHNATYHGFTTLLKWSIAATAILMVSLYFFVIAGEPVIGAAVLLLIPIGAAAVVVRNSRRD
jgi:hypothetical protein